MSRAPIAKGRKLFAAVASVARGSLQRRRFERQQYERWKECAGLSEAVLQQPLRERNLIMSLDQGGYAVGLANASTREAWLEKVLREIPKDARLLDAGAGECQFKKHCDHVRYVSQDLAKYTGAGNAVGLQRGTWDTSAIDIVCDITAIPEPDASFDAILCTEVLEHLTEPVVALRELARLLRIGGTIILTAPFCSLTHFAPYHYATGFSRYFYEHHLGELGFEITDLIENGNFFEYMGQEIRRVGDMGQRYGDGSPNTLERYAIQIVLGMLERMSKEDRGSQEMLHFGYHVRAVKVRNP